MDSLKGCYDLEAVIRGIRKFDASKKVVSEELIAELAHIQERLYNIKAEENIKKADDFLESISKNRGIIQVETKKIFYEDIVQGTGSPLGPEENTIRIKYSIRTLDGIELINTFPQDLPDVIDLRTTIPGFAQGVQGMRTGGRRRLYIHPDYAYKSSGYIPPYSLLIVEVEFD